jgi:hypothetical protein
MTRTQWIAIGAVALLWYAYRKPDAFKIPITRNPDGSLNAPPPPPPDPVELAMYPASRWGSGHF